MDSRLSRRDALRLAGVGAFSLFHPPLLTGCWSDSRGQNNGAKTGLDAGGVPAWNYDPNRSWWMQFNYG
ncbi:MAG TPA: hypothetical protein VF395_14035, partial [Polyangiaceae bacterium]